VCSADLIICNKNSPNIPFKKKYSLRTNEQPSTKDNYERCVSDVCQSEFAHVLFKQTGDRETIDIYTCIYVYEGDGEAATSCASSQIAQSLKNWVERMRRTYLVSLR